VLRQAELGLEATVIVVLRSCSGGRTRVPGGHADDGDEAALVIALEQPPRIVLGHRSASRKDVKGIGETRTLGRRPAVELASAKRRHVRVRRCAGADTGDRGPERDLAGVIAALPLLLEQSGPVGKSAAGVAALGLQGGILLARLDRQRRVADGRVADARELVVIAKDDQVQAAERLCASVSSTAARQRTIRMVRPDLAQTLVNLAPHGKADHALLVDDEVLDPGEPVLQRLQGRRLESAEALVHPDLEQ
jgi:hypothetical protein